MLRCIVFDGRQDWPRVLRGSMKKRTLSGFWLACATGLGPFSLRKPTASYFMILGAFGAITGCDYLDTDAYPTFTGEYRLLADQVEFGGYRTDGISTLEPSAGRKNGNGGISQPEHFPFAVNLPAHVEVWMSPLVQEGQGGYRLEVQVLAQTADGGVSLFKSEVDSEGRVYIPLSETTSYHDATSPTRGLGDGYSCIWEVSAGISIQFNRNLSDFYDVYPTCTPQEGEFQGPPLCVRPQLGRETDLPVLYRELELDRPLQMEWTVTTRRALRADSSSWLCTSNSNYSFLQTGNQVKAVYELETPNWYQGDPRIRDNPELLRAQESRLSELGLEPVQTRRQVGLKSLLDIPSDGFDLDSLYPDVEWFPPDSRSE